MQHLYILDGERRIPYLRGVLVHTLIQRGLKLADARRVTNEVDRTLAGRPGEPIPKKDLVAVVRQAVEKRLGDRYGDDYAFLDELTSTIFVEQNGSSSPFSKGILTQSLQATGLEPNVAYDVARNIESQLIEKQRRNIPRSEIRLLTLKVLRDQYGEVYAERYRIWREFETIARPMIILIGGPTGAGKTSLGIEIAHRLGITRVISTDSIRQIMRLMFSPELMPSIHSSSYDAWKYLTTPLSLNADPVIEGFREQVIRVSVGTRAIIDRAIEENVSMVLDGVHVVPGFIDLELYRNKAYVFTLMVSTLDEARFKHRFISRQEATVTRPVHKYLANLDSILKIQNYVLSMAEQHGAPIIDNLSFDETVAEALRLIGDFLSHQEEFQVKKVRREVNFSFDAYDQND